MRASLPWLCQGDVFDSVPVVQAPKGAKHAFTFRREEGARAVLLTESCQLDKPPREGEAPAISFLQLTPIISLEKAAINSSLLGQLRSGNYVNPPNGFYIDDDGSGAPGIIDLAQAYPLPSTYFDLVIEDFAGNFEIEGDGTLRARPRAHGQRTVTMTPEEIDLLHRKMVAYWTYRQEKK